MTFSNRRVPFSGAALKRPAVVGQPLELGLTELRAGPPPTVPSAAGQWGPAAAASDPQGATDSNSGDSPAPVAAPIGGPAPSEALVGSLAGGSQASPTDSLLGPTDSTPAPQSGGATPCPQTGRADEPADDEERQGHWQRFAGGRTAQFSRKPPRFPPRTAETFAASHNRPDRDSASASGDDAEQIELTAQDDGTKTTQANPTTNSSKGSPNDQRLDQVPGRFDGGMRADQVPGANATGVRKAVHPVAAASAPKKERAVGSTHPSGRFRVFGQEFVAPWNSRAAGIGATLSAYGRAAPVAASAALAGAAGGAAAGFVMGAAIGAVGGATAGGVGAVPGAAAGAASGVIIGAIGGAISGLLAAATAKSEADAANQAVVSGAITGVAGPVGGKVGGAVAGRVMAAGRSARMAGAVGGATGSAAASAVGQRAACVVGFPWGRIP